MVFISRFNGGILWVEECPAKPAILTSENAVNRVRTKLPDLISQDRVERDEYVAREFRTLRDLLPYWGPGVRRRRRSAHTLPKGAIENAIHCLRRALLANLISRHRFAKCGSNDTPRKCLDSMIPVEVFLNQVLHFGCYSTQKSGRLGESRQCRSSAEANCAWRGGT